MSGRSIRAGRVLCAVLTMTITGSDAFAQGAESLLLRSRHVVRDYADAVDPAFTFNAAPAAGLSVEAAMPCRLLAQIQFRPLLDQLWSSSPTFRQQCRRLAGAKALVLMRSVSAKETPWSAESQIGVQANGRVVARMSVREGRESAEIVAHELEHVIERLDGVHLAHDALRAGSGTTLFGGAYETRRATEAGRQAAKETRPRRDAK
jgi:hypothetical protein